MRDGWRTVRLGDLMDRTTDRLGDAPEPRILTCTENHGLVDQIEHMGRRLATEDVSAYKVVEPLDVVYNVYLLWLGAIGQNLTGTVGVTSPAYEVFRPRNAVYGPFLGLLLRSPALLDQFNMISIGTVPRRRRAPWQDFLDVTVTVPPLDEQQHIVDLIGSVDEAIEAADEVAVAAFHSLDIARDQMVWSFQERVALQSLCSIKAKLVDPTLLTTRHLPHIGTERIVSGSGEIVDVVTAAEDGVTSAKFLHGIDDVIYSKIRPNLRKAAMPITIGLCSADAYPLSPNSGVDKLFLQQLLLTSQFTEAAVAKSGRTKMPKINKTELFSITVPLVPRDDQLRLSGVFSVLGESYASSKAYAKTLRNLRTNLLTALLSGAHEIPDSYDDLLAEAM